MLRECEFTTAYTHTVVYLCFIVDTRGSVYKRRLFSSAKYVLFVTYILIDQNLFRSVTELSIMFLKAFNSCYREDVLMFDSKIFPQQPKMWRCITRSA